MPRKAPISFYLRTVYRTDANKQNIANIDGVGVTSTSSTNGLYTTREYKGVAEHNSKREIFTKYFTAKDGFYYNQIPYPAISGKNESSYIVQESNNDTKVSTNGSIGNTTGGMLIASTHATLTTTKGITVGMLVTTSDGSLIEANGVTVVSIISETEVTVSKPVKCPSSNITFSNKGSNGRVFVKYFTVYYKGTEISTIKDDDEIEFIYSLSSNPNVTQAVNTKKSKSVLSVANPVAKRSSATMITGEQDYIINSFTINTDDLTERKATRNFTVVGTPGANFTLSVANENPHTYNFNSETFTSAATSLSGTISTSGEYRGHIVFPAITDDDQYDFTFSAGKKTGLNKSFFRTLTAETDTYQAELYGRTRDISYPIDWTFNIKQYAATTVTFTLQSTNNSSSYNTLPSNVTSTGRRNLRALQGTEVDISWTVTCVNAAHAFHLIRQPIPADWDNANGTVAKTVDGAVSASTGVDIETTGHKTSLSTASIAAGMVVTGVNISPATDGTDVTVASVTDANTIVLSEAQTLSNHDIISFNNGGTTVKFDQLKVEVPYTYAKVHEDASETQNIKLTSAATADEVASEEADDVISSLHSLKTHSTAAYASTVVYGKLPRTVYISSTPASPANGQTWEFSAASTIKAGQIIGFDTSNSATITAKARIMSYGNKNVNIKLELDNILGVGES